MYVVSVFCKRAMVCVYNMMMMTSEQSGVFRSHHLDTHSLCLSCPQEIGSLRNLKFVEVSENQLMFLPLSFSSLVSLQDLHLSDNLLSLLPETMGQSSSPLICLICLISLL